MSWWVGAKCVVIRGRSEEHTSELQSLAYLVCRLLLEKKIYSQRSSLHTSVDVMFDRGCRADVASWCVYSGSETRVCRYENCHPRFCSSFFLMIRRTPRFSIFPSPAPLRV